MSEDRRFEQEQIDAAAEEAGHVGGDPGDQDLDPAERAVIEAGGGESEGFELAEQALIEHATHTDQQSAHVILHHQGFPEEPDADAPQAPGEDSAGDHEASSELESDEN
jgi:hypothetical protein